MLCRKTLLTSRCVNQREREQNNAIYIMLTKVLYLTDHKTKKKRSPSYGYDEN